MDGKIKDNLVHEEAEPGGPLVRVLAVEDDEGLRGVYKYLFGSLVGPNGPFDYYDIAASGGEALAKLKADPGINVLMLDYNMPGLNGADVAKMVKAQDPKVLTVLVSSMVEEDLKKAGEQVYFDMYLPKPFSSQDARNIGQEIKAEIIARYTTNQ